MWGGGGEAISNPLKIVDHKSECTIQLGCFQKISYQKVSYCTRKRPCFHLIPTVPNRIKYHKNACFRCTLYSIMFLQFQIVSDIIRMHAIETLFSLQFQLVSDTTRSDIVFIFFSAVPNRFKYLQSAYFKALKFGLLFQTRAGCQSNICKHV